MEFRQFHIYIMCLPVYPSSKKKAQKLSKKQKKQQEKEQRLKEEQELKLKKDGENDNGVTDESVKQEEPILENRRSSRRGGTVAQQQDHAQQNNDTSDKLQNDKRLDDNSRSDHVKVSYDRIIYKPYAAIYHHIKHATVIALR